MPNRKFLTVSIGLSRVYAVCVSVYEVYVCMSVYECVCMGIGYNVYMVISECGCMYELCVYEYM